LLDRKTFQPATADCICEETVSLTAALVVVVVVVVLAVIAAVVAELVALLDRVVTVVAEVLVVTDDDAAACLISFSRRLNAAISKSNTCTIMYRSISSLVTLDPTLKLTHNIHAPHKTWKL